MPEKEFVAIEVEKLMQKYLNIFASTTNESFKEYCQICKQRQTPYKATTRAMMIRDHFREKIQKTGIFELNENRLEEENNTFYMFLDDFCITFHKLDKNKRKRKYQDEIKLSVLENIEQLTFKIDNINIRKNLINKNTPLTLGYILNPLGTEIVGLYLTYQVGKVVLWHKKINTVTQLAIEKTRKIPRVG